MTPTHHLVQKTKNVLKNQSKRTSKKDISRIMEDLEKEIQQSCLKNNQKTQLFKHMNIIS